jgi:alkaline phosphatase D
LNAQSANRFYDEVIGAEDRQMISEDMENFLRIELDESVKAGRPWRIIANQTLMARITTPKLDDTQFQALTRDQYDKNGALIDRLTRNGGLNMVRYTDGWDGYPAARERLYELAAGIGARDLLVISGDSHEFWQNRLENAAGDPMGVELGTGAITSPRGNYELGEAATARFSELISARNESVVWNDGRYRGYIRLSLSKDLACADYVVISTVESRDYSIQKLRSTTIVRDGDTLVYA